MRTIGKILRLRYQILTNSLRGDTGSARLWPILGTEPPARRICKPEPVEIQPVRFQPVRYVSVRFSGFKTDREKTRTIPSASTVSAVTELYLRPNVSFKQKQN